MRIFRWTRPGGTRNNIYCHMFQEAQAKVSDAVSNALNFNKKEPKVSYPRLAECKNFRIRTPAVTEIKDFEQQREPCCYAIKNNRTFPVKKKTLKRLF